MQEQAACRLLEDYRSNIRKILRFSILIDSYSINTFREYQLSTMGQLNRIQELFARQREYIKEIRKVRESLCKLPEIEKKCLIHFYIKGLKGKDIEKHFPFTERTFYRYKGKGLTRFIAFMQGEALAA